MKIILHPTDFSGCADHALRMARLIARESGARLVVLHVVDLHLDVSPVVYWELGVPFLLPRDHEEYHSALQEQIREKFRGDPELCVEARVRDGDVAEEIFRTAEEAGSDLIVMGTHGRKGLSRLLMGSVAEAVLRNAPCPVLIVRDPRPAPASEEIVPGQEPVSA